MKRLIPCLLALVLAVSLITPALAAPDTPMDADWGEAVEVEEERVDLTAGSETRPAEEFYAVACSLMGLAHFEYVKETETESGVCYDLNLDGIDDILLTSADNGETTTIQRLDTCSLERGYELSLLGSEELEYMRSQPIPGFAKTVTFLMPSQDPDRVQSVGIHGFQYPEAGMTVGENLSSITVDNAEIFEPFEPYATFAWYDTEDRGGNGSHMAGSQILPLLESDVFQPGRSYYLRINLTLKDGKFAENATFRLYDIDDKTVDLKQPNYPSDKDEIGNGYYLDPYMVMMSTGEFKVPDNSQSSDGTHVVKADAVTVQAEPDLDSSQVGSLTKGDGVTVTETYGDWDKIRLDDGKTGWVLRQQLDPVAPEPENPFQDVAVTDGCYMPVLWAYYSDPQITNGMDETHFGPNLTVTRGQCVTFLWRSQGCPKPASSVNPFVDVSADQYYYDAVLWAYYSDPQITNGVDATHFAPDVTLSTAHITTFLYRALGIGTDGWYQDAAKWADDWNLTELIDLDIAPGVDCPRGVVVTFLYRALPDTGQRSK
ncbi:MAG: SH3 domain-containing protein [Oscillospiraceae bacterium]|nr:SH3 domain-containing protein [Oscillospiraceae bacterium]